MHLKLLNDILRAFSSSSYYLEGLLRDAACWDVAAREADRAESHDTWHLRHRDRGGPARCVRGTQSELLDKEERSGGT